MRNDIRQDGKLDMKQDGKTEKEKEIKEIVKGFVGRNMSIVLRNKKMLAGKLESVSHYELLLTISHKPVLVMKHAIDYIELTED